MSTHKQRDASKEQFWRRVLRQWRRSGLTVRAFCQQHGLAHCAAPRLGLWLECRSPGCYNADVCPEDAMITLLAAYSYNALNRRIIEDDGTTATHLFYSANWQVLEEQVGGQATTQYVWSPVYIDALILRDRDTDSDGDLDERLYIQQDANWNVTALVDALTGDVVQDPFGLVTVLDSSFSPTADAFDWKYLHQGLRLDVAVGMNLYDGRNRIYDPVLQRWFQVDPSGFDAGDSNLYRYVGNGPIHKTDAFGLYEEYHHWFPRFNGTGQGFIDDKCKCVGVHLNIHDFTTPLEAGFRRAAHNALHNDYPLPVGSGGGGYNQAAAPIIKTFPGCCSTLVGISALIVTSWTWLQDQHFKVPAFPTFYRWKTRVPTSPVLLPNLIKRACEVKPRDPPPPPVPIPIPETGRVRVRETERITDWAFRAPPPEVVAGAAAVGVAAAGVGLLFTPAAPVGVGLIAVGLFVGFWSSDSSA